MRDILMNKIRKANRDDAEAILKVYNDGNKIYGYPDQDILDTFMEMITENQTFVLSDKKNIIGFCSYIIKNSHAFISALYIKRDKQRSGLGSELLTYIEQIILTKDKCSYIILKALKPSNCVIEFYLRNGYTLFCEDNIADEVLNTYLPLKNWDVLLFKHYNISENASIPVETC